ncbi:MAG: hypothetical protein H6625_02730 [Bdellovibrionaceae bacterium]|nr:hypothetical protein [Pseudobdellovibrionaceae bacterium]
MTLPTYQNPIWAIDSINLNGVNNVVAVDDDPSVLNQWRQKVLKDNQNELGFCGYESGERFLNENQPQDRAIYLIDHDLGKYTVNGLNLAAKIENKDAIYMVTNNFDDWEVQRFCEDFSVKLIPKTVIPMLELCYN